MVCKLVKLKSYKETPKSKYKFNDTNLFTIEKFWKLAKLFFLLAIRNFLQYYIHNLSQNYSALYLLSKSFNNDKST